MNEIITIHLGQGGNRIGCKFWEMFFREHEIDHTRRWRGHDERQREHVEIFCHKVPGGAYIPRAILADLDHRLTTEVYGSGSFAEIFRPDNFFFTKAEGTTKNWAKGFYTQGTEYIEQVLEGVRREVDTIDYRNFQGFMLLHTLGGGTGSGMGALLLSKLKEEYPEKPIVTFSVFPSSTQLGCSSASDKSITSAYNATLGIEHLIKNADLTFCFDNEHLYNTCRHSLGIQNPSWNDINYTVAQTISGLTVPLRLPLANSDRWTLKDMVANLAPSPDLKFITPGLAPILSIGSRQYEARTLPELVPQMFNVDNMLAAADPRQGQLLKAYTCFRGDMSSRDVDQQMSKIQVENADYIRSSISDSVHNLVCEIPTFALEYSATFANNTTAIQILLLRVLEEFDTLFRRKEFFDFYTYEGMNEQQFREAERNLQSLISEYEQVSEGR